MRIKKSYLKSLGLAALFICMLTPGTARANLQAPLHVVASFSILGDMANEVGGSTVKVETLVGPDTDVHTYEPTPADAVKISQADLIIINGLGLEGWLDRLIAASNTHAKIITATTGIKPHKMDEDGKQITDPHAWQNLENGKIYVQNIAAAFEAALPELKNSIHSRAAEYTGKIDHENNEIKEMVASIPEHKRVIITSHDAFGYFGAAYGIKFKAPVGISTEAEPTAKDVARLIRQIKSEGIKTLFLENMVSSRLIDQIAQSTGAKIGGTLYADGLSGPNGPAPHYLDMFKNNLPLMYAAMNEKN